MTCKPCSALNRTSVELKLKKRTGLNLIAPTLNRTSVELKPAVAEMGYASLLVP